MAPQESPSQPGPLLPTTLGGGVRQAGRKRKTDPDNPENAKKCRGYREQQKKAVQGEKDDLESLEKENRELIKEETALKNQLERMRETYLGFINEGRLVWQDDALEGASSPACCSLSQTSSGYSSASPSSSCSSPEDSRLRRPSQDSFVFENNGSPQQLGPSSLESHFEDSNVAMSVTSPYGSPASTMTVPFASPAPEPLTYTISVPFMSPAPEPPTYTVCVPLRSPKAAYLPIATTLAGFLDPRLDATPASMSFPTSPNSTVIVEEIFPITPTCFMDFQDVNGILQLTDSLMLPSTLDMA